MLGVSDALKAKLFQVVVVVSEEAEIVVEPRDVPDGFPELSLWISMMRSSMGVPNMRSGK